MKDIVGKILNRIKADRIRHRRVRLVLLVLSLFVATGVLWRLKITGITMTGEALCGQLEHLHTAQCLSTTEVCGLEETDGHEHNADCRRTLQCTIEAHAHEDACYETAELPLCGQEEAEAHHHSEACLQETYVCGQEEHRHSLLCYSNPEADLESSSDWEKTIPAMTQDASADLVAVARSQLGYTESRENYKVADDGVTRLGYTRYGEWYGNPYGKWNAMFVSFCLRYAEHPAYEALKNSGAETMRLAAEKAGVYQAASGVIPGEGDLVFLDKDSSGSCDAVAIVSGCYEGGLRVVEGSCDGAVAENEYPLDHGAVLGYALLTPQIATTEEIVEDADPQEDEAEALEDDGITIRFVIGDANYTYDPGDAHTTHITVDSTEDLVADGGLTYTEWSGQDQYMVTGTGTLDAVSIPSGGSLSGSGYILPKINVINMNPEVDRQYTYASAYNWVTDTGLICNEKTVFTENTTLFLSLYESGTTCGLNWVCNCDAGGTHSVTYYVSGFGSPVFAWGQSLSKPYIPTAAAVNSAYTGSAFCTAGPDHGMELRGWYVKDADGNETDFSAGMPILESYKDPDSSGYSVKIYARWEKTEEPVQTVTATFVNGQETATVSLNKGDSLGDKLPAVTAPEGQVFVGWQIGDTTDYATAETVIEEDTTYTAVFAATVTVTFMHDGVQYGETVTIPEGTLLWSYLPAQEPEYSGDEEMPMVFAGWKIGDTDIFVTEQTAAEAGMVLHAAFEEVAGFDIYLHDMAPDGVTDYELDGQDVEISQRYLHEGMTLAEEFSAYPYAMLRDAVPATQCIWYLKDSDGTYVPYDLATPVTSDLHLYTFHYSVTLVCEEARNVSGTQTLFAAAGQAKVTVNGNTLTLTLREGEKPAASDFVIGGVDYSVYNWSFADESGAALELTLGDILKNGVTENVKATSAADDLVIQETAVANVRFKIIINEELKELEQRAVTVYKLNGYDSFAISQETLKEVYQDYGFTVEQWVNNQYSCPQMVDGTDSRYWANNELRLANGLYYNPSVGNAGTGSEVLYLPTNNTVISGAPWTDYKQSQSFYTVTVSDPEGIVYSDKSRIPAVQYVFRNGQIAVTVPAAEGIQWTYTGKNATDTIHATKTDNADGTVTFTFDSITCPVELKPVYTSLSSANKEINFYVFLDNEQKLVASGTYPAYLEGQRYYLSASLLEQVYREYGFTADQLNNASQRYFPHAKENNDPLWADAAPMQKENGAWFVPILGTENDTAKCDIFYVPGYEGTWNVDKAYLKPNYSFYTVKVTDPKNLVYGADQQLPETQIVFTGTTAKVTVKTSDPDEITVPGGRYYWMVGGVELTNGENNGDGTTTYTIANVQEPLVMTPERNFVNVVVEDDQSLVYTAEEAKPRVQVLKGDTAVITVRCSSGCGWLANGRSIPGSVYGETEITYTFADLTEDIVLKPVAMKNEYTVRYDINLTYPADPANQAPTMTVLSETYTGQSTGYIVQAPDRLEYSTTGWGAFRAVVFDGWTADGDESRILEAGRVLAMEDLAAADTDGDGIINLSAKWTEQGNHGSVTFYVNLELHVADYNGSTEGTESHNYTDALYSSSVSVTPLPGDENTAYSGEIVLQAENATATAAIDAKIRQLAEGVDARFMGQTRRFKLNGFPEDEYILQTARAKQTEYIQNFESWKNSEEAEDKDLDGVIDVADYRAAGKKIIAVDGELIPVSELTSDNYTIRWYVFKYETYQENGWHIDGVLVKKQAQLTVTKTFYGDADAVAEVKKNYSIDVIGIDDTDDGIDNQPTLYTLTLSALDTQGNRDGSGTIEQGFTDYDPTTDTYTWVVNLTADWDAWLYERNYTYTQNDVVTLSEYLSYNFTNTVYNQTRTKYNETAGVRVAVKSHGVDQDYRTFETTSFYNTYLPSAAVLISKVDDTGKPLTGVSFTLSGTFENQEVPASIYQDTRGVYYYRPDSTQGDPDPDWTEVDYITVDEMGYAQVMGLKAEELRYTFTLVEASAPEGYTSVDQPIKFSIDEQGNIVLSADTTASGMVDDADGKAIHVTNTAQTMSVTAVKQWADGTDKKVTLQLMLNGSPLPGKVAELDGTADEAAEGVTDGYESEAWTVTWDDLPAYTGGKAAVYSIRETWIDNVGFDAAYGDGYANYHVLVSDMQTVKDENGIPVSATITVTNRRQLSGLEFTKTDETGRALAGAVFQLYTDAECTEVYGTPRTSDDGGIVNFGSLAAGTYYMKETTVPTGYQPNHTVYIITVHAGKTTITVYGSTLPITSIANDSKPAELKLQKVDQDRKPLSDAVFEVWKQDSVTGEYSKISQTVDGELVNQFAVDADGKLVISGLTRGSYKLVEFSAPDGYYRLAEQIEFTVSKGEINCSGKSLNWSFNDTTDTFTVVNVAGSALPQTGGMGTHYGTMAGLLMMAGSLLYRFLLRRKRERGTV